MADENPTTYNLASVTIGDITLTFRREDAGGTHYYGRSHFEEYHSPFYPILRTAISPEICIDVGANYGYTGLLMRRAFPKCALTLVEPIPWLAEFIHTNFAANGMKFDCFHSAIASNGSETGRSLFGLNEKGSQDSRVTPLKGWPVVETDVVTLDKITADVSESQGVYIKIDTQGWEEHVFAGGYEFLSRHPKWFIKTEFAPQWMDSQGSDPVNMLRDLTARYDVFESPGRQRWNSSTLEDILGTPLHSGCEFEFVDYVRKLAMHGRGWVDLYVLPPAHRRTFHTARRVNPVNRIKQAWNRWLSTRRS
ncbi:FkbM family methyltransferase [Shinella sp. BYT-45]|uniref:FkbM family methyltransferase n=1 Tax=Shinella sp. BYT-45 TaxID=3377377 RepID=UPI0039802103